MSRKGCSFLCILLKNFLVKLAISQFFELSKIHRIQDFNVLGPELNLIKKLRSTAPSNPAIDRLTALSYQFASSLMRNKETGISKRSSGACQQPLKLQLHKNITSEKIEGDNNAKEYESEQFEDNEISFNKYEKLTRSKSTPIPILDSKQYF